MILSVLVVLSLWIFIPPPESPKYDVGQEKCATGDQACLEGQIQENEKKQQAYNAEREVYGDKIFKFSGIVGLILILLSLISFWSRLGLIISAGIILAGAFAILYGYIQII